MLEEYYNNYDESNRLKTDNAHAIEYITTLHFLKEHITPGASVLDCCAGGGCYAFALARLGYKVTAGDLIQKHVDIMKADKDSVLLQQIYQGNVLELPFGNGVFDAVLCLGALYHIHSKQERIKCIAECLRVLKNDGIFIFSYINRNAIIINHFKLRPAEIEKEFEIYKSGHNDVFYGMDFGEADDMTQLFNLNKITEIGINGLMYPLKNEINFLTEEQFKHYMDYHFLTCQQPSILGSSMHGLWIGRKTK